MKKKVWIMNHYATNSYFNKGGRHYWLAENLIKNGYQPTIFCANTRHSSEDLIDTKASKYVVDNVEGISFVFVKTSKYEGNGISRVKNMFNFFRNLFSVSKKYAEKEGKPDIIIGSSVHPLTSVAGIKIAKKFDVPCISEVRDLWPESIVELQDMKRNSPIIKLLYMLEKWIYKKSDRLIFTMEGGRDYIVDNKWDKGQGGPIDIENVRHINNGVNLISYKDNIKNEVYTDKDLGDSSKFKIVYTGSIGRANNVGLIIDAAKHIKDSGENIKFIIFGDGKEKKKLQQKCIDEGINNVIFKGKVEKNYVPSILSRSDLNIFTGNQSNLYRYGLSLNKMFEYFASGKPTLSNIECRYDIIEKYKCGITVEAGSSEAIADGILKFYNMNKKEYNKYCENALDAAEAYDFKILTNKLIDIIEEV